MNVYSYYFLESERITGNFVRTTNCVGKSLSSIIQSDLSTVNHYKDS